MDMTSSVFNNSFSMGYIIGTSMGGTLVTYFGFINTSIYFSFGIIGFSLIYLIKNYVIITKSKIGDDL